MSSSARLRLLLTSKLARVTLAIMLVVLLFPVSVLEAASTFTAVDVGSQTGSLTYGTAGTATYVVTVHRTGDGNLTVSLAASGLPAGASASFSPASVKFTGGTLTSLDSTLTITTSTFTPSESVSFTVTGSDGSIQKQGTGTLAIAKKGLTVSGVTASNKVYDGTTAAALNTTSAELVGVVAGDSVTLDATGASGAFSDKNVGNGKTVTVNGLKLSGDDTAYYSLAQPTATANITPLPITVSAATDSKVYDGKTTSAGVPQITSGSLVTGDTAGFTQAFDTKNVGTSKTLTPAGHVNDGNGGNNYAVTFVDRTDGSITARDLTVTATGVDKPYDGTTAATVTLSSDAVPGDVLTLSYESASFASASVGTDKPVSVTGISVGGADAANYTLKNTTAETTADITKASTTVAITSSHNPSDPGEAVTFTATVSPAVATGTVQFKDGAADLGAPITLSGGTATLTTSSLTGGTHHITAVYSGDTTYATSTSTILDQVVARDTSTTSVTSSAKPSVYGQSVTFTATVNHADATGTIAFKDGSATLHTCTLASASCSYTTSALTVGTHNITAVYSGSADYGSSTGTLSGGQVVDKANTTTTITSDLSAATVVGESYTVAFTVAAVAPGAGTPTGNVTVSDGSATCTASVAAGSCSLASASAGSKTIVATFGGDADFNGSASAGVTHTVNKASTTTTLTSSKNPTAYGESVTFTATVSAVAPGAGVVTGTVTFMDGSTVMGTASLSGGEATFQTSMHYVSDHAITAVYEGNSDYNPSTSETLTQTVLKSDSTVQLTSSKNPSAYGESVTFTATVCGLPAVVGPLATIQEACFATGIVSFWDGETLLGQGTLSSGEATFTTSGLSVGDHDITAKYEGDVNYNVGVSSVLVQVVVKADQTIVFGALSDKTVGDADFTVSATGGASGNPVVFTSSTPGTCTTSGTNGSTVHLVAAGKCTIVANQEGNESYNAAAPVSQGFTVKPAATELPKTGDPWAGPFTLAILLLALGSTALMVGRLRVSVR